MTVAASDLPKCLQKYASIIDEVSDERSDGDGYWVYLIVGLWSPDDETHCIHEGNPRACISKLKSVAKCPLKNCCHN